MRRRFFFFFPARARSPPPIPTLPHPHSAAIAAAKAGTTDAVAFTAATRGALGEVMYAAWPENKSTASAAHALLDTLNAGLADLERRAAASPSTSAGAGEAAAGGDTAAPLLSTLDRVAAFWGADAAPQSLADVLALGAVRGGPPGAGTGAAPEKRGRGRPKGSRTKRPRAAAAVRVPGVPMFVSDLPPPLAKELAWLLEAATARGDAPPRPDDTGAPTRLRSAVAASFASLRATHASEATRVLEVDIGPVARLLREGRYDDVERLCADVAAAARAGAEAAADAASLDVRRGKLLGLADAFAMALTGAVTELAIEHGPSKAEREAAASAAVAAASGAAGAAAAAAAAAAGRTAPLPPAIAANYEPFFHGPWRRRPYAPRPYVKLAAYEADEECAWKLTTDKAGACDGVACTAGPGKLGAFKLEQVEAAASFDTACSCLAKNTECGDACACAPGTACSNRAVSGRHTLVPGTDVREVHAWGVDCYTRRNITDAVLECGAFGPFTPPDYRALAAAAAAEADALARGETIKRDDGGGGDGSRPGSAALGAARGVDATTRDAAVAWVERTLFPAINRQGASGWDIGRALDVVTAAAEAAGDTASAAAAAAVRARAEAVGPDFFRVHPKGVGMVCQREGGLPPLTFVEEYLGEVHAPWRWFEIQDAIKKVRKERVDGLCARVFGRKTTTQPTQSPPTHSPPHPGLPRRAAGLLQHRPGAPPRRPRRLRLPVCRRGGQGRVCVAHVPFLHPQLPGRRHGLRRPPHHRRLHAAPRARRGGADV